jgi:ABC-type oligopeptide transport system substrate-binding subunit
MRFQTWVRPVFVFLMAHALFVVSPVPRAVGAAVHISTAPAWFDPGEHPGGITRMVVFYALHDALVKLMPGNPMAPSRAESWTVSPDGLAYEFALPPRRHVFPVERHCISASPARAGLRP